MTPSETLDLKRQVEHTFQKTKRITTSMLRDAHADTHYRKRVLAGAFGQTAQVDPSLYALTGATRRHVEETVKALDGLIGEFRRRYWMGGLCAKVAAHQGLQGEMGEIEVQILHLAGRGMITVRGDKTVRRDNSDVFVTLMADPSNVTGGIALEGINATREEAVALLHDLAFALPPLEPDLVLPA